MNGSNKADTVAVGVSGAQVVASGLFAQTRVVASEPALDTLRVQTRDGNDTVTVAPDVASLINPVVDLGANE